MTKQTLLEKALNTPARAIRAQEYTVEDFYLVEAWLDDKITIGQLCAAIGADPKSATKAYIYIAMVCREMRRR